MLMDSLRPLPCLDIGFATFIRSLHCAVYICCRSCWILSFLSFLLRLARLCALTRFRVPNSLTHSTTRSSSRCTVHSCLFSPQSCLSLCGTGTGGVAFSSAFFMTSSGLDDSPLTTTALQSISKQPGVLPNQRTLQDIPSRILGSAFQASQFRLSVISFHALFHITGLNLSCFVKLTS